MKNNIVIIIESIFIVILIFVLGYFYFENQNNKLNKSKPQVEEVEEEEKEIKNNKSNTINSTYLIFNNTDLSNDYDEKINSVKVDNITSDMSIVKDTSSNKSKISFNNKTNEYFNSTITSVSIMNNNFLAVGILSSDFEFYIYDSNFNLVEKFGNSLGLVSNSKLEVNNLVIDDKNLIYYECNLDSNSDKQTLGIYLLKFDGSSYKNELINEMSNITCSSQS